MILHECHEVTVYYEEHETKEALEWQRSWIEKGYKEQAHYKAKNGEQGAITMVYKIIPKEWLEN